MVGPRTGATTPRRGRRFAPRLCRLDETPRLDAAAAASGRRPIHHLAHCVELIDEQHARPLLGERLDAGDYVAAHAERLRDVRQRAHVRGQASALTPRTGTPSASSCATRAARSADFPDPASSDSTGSLRTAPCGFGRVDRRIQPLHLRAPDVARPLAELGGAGDRVGAGVLGLDRPARSTARRWWRTISTTLALIASVTCRYATSRHASEAARPRRRASANETRATSSSARRPESARRRSAPHALDAFRGGQGR